MADSEALRHRQIHSDRTSLDLNQWWPKPITNQWTRNEAAEPRLIDEQGYTIAGAFLTGLECTMSVWTRPSQVQPNCRNRMSTKLRYGLVALNIIHHVVP